MALPNELHPLQLGAGSASASAYQIEQSLRFEPSDNHSLSRTFSSAGNQKTFTLSLWVKRSHKQELSQYLVSTAIPSGWSGFYYLQLYGNGPEITEIAAGQGRNSGLNYAYTNRKLRDFSGWYHIVYVADYSNATADDRFRLYVNGQRDTSFRSSIAFVDEIGSWNAASVVHYIGRHPTGTNGNFGGYLAEFHHVDGQVLDPTDFGEFDSNGVWRPIEATGLTYGTNGFYLKFDPSATNGIGHDHSGNGNNFTATGFSTSGTGTDVMSDTPTTNYATLNATAKNSNTTLSEGNLRATGSSSTAYNANTQATFAQSSGKWYYEATYVSSSSTLEALGWARTTLNHNQNPTLGDALLYRPSYGDYLDFSAVSDTTPGSTSTGTVIQVAIDLDAGKLWFGGGGTWFNSGNPATGSNASMTFTGGAEELSPFVRTLAATFEFNFGQRAFEYTPPTDFLPLNTSNLPAPDIADGSDYFNTVLYNGNGSTQSITGVGFSPSFVWTKGRSGSYGASNHKLFDTVRGATKTLFGNLTLAEATQTNGLTSFDSDGFSLGNDTNVNASSTTFVAWNWLASNTSGSSNTDGSITSTVSANPTAGFSIVSYTGTGASATVGHGLGVAPKMVIVKRRDDSTNWPVWFEAVSSGGSKFLELNQTNGEVANSAFFDGASTTSTTFPLGSGAGQTNASGSGHIAYCFAEVEGYSKFSSYTGNGNADGPFLYCGFRPAWIMYKITNTTGNWIIHDTTRSEYNVTTNRLFANLTNAEGTSATVSWDLLSNGAKIRTSDAGVNGSGNTFIFAAFAENPFGGDGVSPATAR